jgi:solute:Na+ symporter, SSS family
LVFSFYQFVPEPVFFNNSQLIRLEHSRFKDSLAQIHTEYDALQTAKVMQMKLLAANSLQQDPGKWQQVQQVLQESEQKKLQFRSSIKRWLNDKQVDGESNDTNYIFLRFVVDFLPKGLVGLLIAVIFLAAWGSIAAALNALASCCVVDFHKRFSKKPLSVKKEYALSKWYSLFWGLFCIIVAQLAYNIGNSLIEAVNVLGSLFYGVMLGIFLVAFYFKAVQGTAVFMSSLVVEGLVIALHILNQRGIISLSFLWLNLVGAVGVVLLSILVDQAIKRGRPATSP